MMITALDEVARLLAAAARTSDRRTRAVLLGEAEILLAQVGVLLEEMRGQFDAARGELRRLSALGVD